MRFSCISNLSRNPNPDPLHMKMGQPVTIYGVKLLKAGLSCSVLPLPTLLESVVSITLYKVLFFFKYVLLIMLLQLSQFFSLCPPSPANPLPSSNVPAPRPRLVHAHGLLQHVCSLASPFPILFLTSPSLFCSYQLCFL